MNTVSRPQPTPKMIWPFGVMGTRGVVRRHKDGAQHDAAAEQAVGHPGEALVAASGKEEGDDGHGEQIAQGDCGER